MIGLALSFITGSLGSAGRFLLRNPLVLALALVGLWGLYQHHEATKAREEAAKWHKLADQCQMASQQAQKTQEALRAQEAKDYHDKAAMADAKYAADLDRVRAATRAYADSHRVQALRASTAQPVSASGSAGVHEGVPADSFVAISDVDLQKCSTDATYAVGAYNFGQSISAPPEVKAP